MDSDRWQLVRIGNNSSDRDNYDLSVYKEYLIGRYRDNNIILKSLHVSRRHCRIQNNGGSLSIIDNNSENGTYINEVQIADPHTPQALKPGDVVGIGAPTHDNETTFVFRLEHFPRRKLSTCSANKTFGQNFQYVDKVSNPIIFSELLPRVCEPAKTQGANATVNAAPAEFAPSNRELQKDSKRFQVHATPAIYIRTPGSRSPASDTPVRESQHSAFDIPTTEKLAQNAGPAVLNICTGSSAQESKLPISKLPDSTATELSVLGSKHAKRKQDLKEIHSGCDSRAKRPCQQSATVNLNEHSVKVPPESVVIVQATNESNASDYRNNGGTMQANSRTFSGSCTFQSDTDDVNCIVISDDDEEVMSIVIEQDDKIDKQDMPIRIGETCQRNEFLGASGKEVPSQLSKIEMMNVNDKETDKEQNAVDLMGRMSPIFTSSQIDAFASDIDDLLGHSNPPRTCLASDPQESQLMDLNRECTKSNYTCMDLNKTADETDSKNSVSQRSSHYSTKEIEYIVITDDEDDSLFPASQLFSDSHSLSALKKELDASNSDDDIPQNADDSADDVDGNESPSEFSGSVPVEEEDDDEDSSDGWYIKLSQSKSSKNIPLKVSEIEKQLAQTKEIHYSSDSESNDDIIPRRVIKKSQLKISDTSSHEDHPPAAPRPSVVSWLNDSDSSDPTVEPVAALEPPAPLEASNSDSSDDVFQEPTTLQMNLGKISDIEQSRLERREKLRPKLIDAFPLPPRRGHQRGISASESERLVKKNAIQMSKPYAEDYDLIEKGKKLAEEQRRKKQEEENATRLAEEQCVEPGLPVKIRKHRISSVKSRNQKKKTEEVEEKKKEKRNKSKSKADIVENLKLLRNERLKEIAAKAKADKLKETNEANHAKKILQKPTIKLTENNRGAFLIESAAGSSLTLPKAASSLLKFSDLPRIPKLRKSVPTAGKDSSTFHPRSPLNTFETDTSTRPQAQQGPSRRSSAPLASDGGKLQRRDPVPALPTGTSNLTANQQEGLSQSARPVSPNATIILGHVDVNRGCSNAPAQTKQPAGFPKCQSVPSVKRSASSSLKSCLKSPLHKGRRKIIRWNEAKLCQTRIVERYIRQMAPHPVGNAKDLPPPNNYRAHNMLATCPNLYETISDICGWNTGWLTEQTGNSEPPPVNYKNPQFNMLTQFYSYADYCKVVRPLMILDLWASIWKDNNESINREPFLIGLDSVTRIKKFITNNKCLDSVECHGLLTAEESRQNRYPHVGDLVLFELVLEKDEKTGQPKCARAGVSNVAPITASKVVRISFAYVVDVRKKPFTDKSIGHIGLFAKIQNAKVQVYLNLLTKRRECVICFHSITRLRVIGSIRSKLRSFEALEFLEHSPLCKFILKPVLQDYLLPQVNTSEILDLSTKGQLNDNQKMAVLKSSKACLMEKPKICLIQGPPGTGKSHVIVNLIFHILGSNTNQRPKILLCAPSNAAVDEIVIRLLGIQQQTEKHRQFKMVRVGRLDTMDPAVRKASLDELTTKSLACQRGLENLDNISLELNTLQAKLRKVQLELDYAKKNNRETAFLLTKFATYEQTIRNIEMGRSIEKSPYEKYLERCDAERLVLDEANIIAVTLTSSAVKIMENLAGQFSCCIVDEASQCSEPDCLLPLMLGMQTLVLVGDPKQLPATTYCQVAKRLGFGQSLLTRLSRCFTDQNSNPIQVLTQQYRMHPEILKWPNSTFYESQLITPNEVDRDSPFRPYRIIKHDFQQSSRELSNHKEAELVVSLVQCVLNVLTEHGMTLNVGVITPYSKQRNKIRDMLYHCGLEESVTVNTIDGYQGKERDVIIMSCVRTQGLGFMSDAQRLNVSLTRARFSMIICANFQSLEDDPLWRSLKEDGLVRTSVVRILPRHLQNSKALEAELLRI